MVDRGDKKLTSEEHDGSGFRTADSVRYRFGVEHIVGECYVTVIF